MYTGGHGGYSQFTHIRPSSQFTVRANAFAVKGEQILPFQFVYTNNSPATSVILLIPFTSYGDR